MTRPPARQSRGQIPARGRDFSIPQKVQTGSGAQTASYSEGNRAISLGVKQGIA